MMTMPNLSTEAPGIPTSSVKRPAKGRIILVIALLEKTRIRLRRRLAPDQIWSPDLPRSNPLRRCGSPNPRQTATGDGLPRRRGWSVNCSSNC
jgi:hypothetical protein